MSFFEPPPPPPEAPADPPAPEWHGPPENALPASFPLDLVLARTDELALFVHSGRAYDSGFEFTFGLRTHPQRRRETDPLRAWREAPGGELSDDVLRFGIAFADGRKATVFDRHRWQRDREDTSAPGIVLMQRGGGGGGASWDFRFWAWPLPPDGPIEFVTEWPSEGVGLTRAQVDSTVVRDAAARAVTLWPDAGRGGMSRAWTHMRK